MAKVLFKDLDNNFFDLFQDMNNLFDKIGKFWVMKFEISCNPDPSIQYSYHTMAGSVSMKKEELYKRQAGFLLPEHIAVNSTIIKHHIQPVDSSLMAISVFLGIVD